MVCIVIVQRRHRAQLERIFAEEREWELTEKTTLRAFGAEIWDCGCTDIYFCPTSKEMECPRHSGFAVCCAAPEAHILVRPLAVDASSPGESVAVSAPGGNRSGGGARG